MVLAFIRLEVIAASRSYHPITADLSTVRHSPSQQRPVPAASLNYRPLRAIRRQNATWDLDCSCHETDSAMPTEKRLNNRTSFNATVLHWAFYTFVGLLETTVADSG